MTNWESSIDIYVLCVCELSHPVIPALCDPLDWSPLGSSAHGIFQSRILDWVPFSTPMDFSQPRDRTLLNLLKWQADSLPLAPPTITLIRRKLDSE